MSRFRFLGVLVALIAALSCGRPARWNVVLITLDTTRADRLGAYGHADAFTPVIDALAAESWVFESAFATNPITLPSHTSILSGTYPLFHGVRDNTAFRVPDELTMLPEVLKENGWNTAAFVGAFVLDSQFNLDQGFDVYDDQLDRNWAKTEIDARAADAFGFPERKANLVTRAALDWLEGEPSEPFFVWLHYFDPHEPKNPPEPYHSNSPTPYDAEIAYTDEQIGVFLAHLDDRGLLERTLIVLTADHGEGLMDHGEPTHSLLIFDSTMRVPLLFRVPGRAEPERSTVLASIVDITPTVLSLLGIPAPDEIQGYALLGPEGAMSPPRDRAVYSESLVGQLQHGWGALRALRTEREKIIHGPAPRYYRVDEDPDEVYDLSRREPEEVERLTRDLQRAIRHWSKDGGADARVEPGAETISKLQSLGYAAAAQSSQRVSDDLTSASSAVDPHEKRYLFDLYGVATENIRQGQHLRALRQLDEVIAADPKNSAAMTSLAITYLIDAAQPLKAKELFEQSLAVDPTQEQALYFLAQLETAMGDADAARRHLEEILEFRPASVPALLALGRWHQRDGGSETALEHFQLALEIDPSNVDTLVALAAFHGRAQELDRSGDYLRRALEVAPDNPHVLYNVGVWHLQQRDYEEAVAQLNRALAVNPADLDAHFVLGRIYAETGQTDLARRALEKARQLSGRNRARMLEIEALLDRLNS